MVGLLPLPFTRLLNYAIKGRTYSKIYAKYLWLRLDCTITSHFVTYCCYEDWRLDYKNSSELSRKKVRSQELPMKTSVPICLDCRNRLFRSLFQLSHHQKAWCRFANHSLSTSWRFSMLFGSFGCCIPWRTCWGFVVRDLFSHPQYSVCKNGHARNNRLWAIAAIWVKRLNC